jgi:hypothetical protein
MKTLLSEARVFGVTVFGDGATIKNVPLVNVLAACVNNPFALLEITDCTAHLAEGGKKDTMHKKTSPGIVDLVFFDGASNVQNAGKILRAFNPRITVGHGAEHVVSLFFADVYTKVKSFMLLCAFAKRVCNIFGAVRHSPLAMFKKYSCQHNHGVHLGFVKPSECWMAGNHIAILRLLRLKNALTSTILSEEFINLRVFDSVCQVLMSPDFWKWAFVMCRALYAPMLGGPLIKYLSSSPFFSLFGLTAVLKILSFPSSDVGSNIANYDNIGINNPSSKSTPLHTLPDAILVPAQRCFVSPTGRPI